MKITFLGGGNMADALIGGLLAQGFAANDLHVVERSAAQCAQLIERYGISCAEAFDARALDCDLIMLAVKPQQMQSAVAPLAATGTATGLTGQVVVSIAAGLRLDDLSRWLGGYRRLVRCMPNTPALIRAGITGLFALPEVSEAQRNVAEVVLSAVGDTLWVGEEAQIDAVTAISGSGPAYVFLFIEALQQAATEMGFTADDARRLAIATTLGAARLAEHSAEPASVLRERVTSKGGTTAAALAQMAASGVLPGLVAGAHAARARSQELGVLLGQDAD